MYGSNRSNVCYRHTVLLEEGPGEWPVPPDSDAQSPIGLRTLLTCRLLVALLYYAEQIGPIQFINRLLVALFSSYSMNRMEWIECVHRMRSLLRRFLPKGSPMLDAQDALKRL